MVLFDAIFAAFQYVLPHHLLSWLVRQLTRIRFAPVKYVEIGLFSVLANIDWDEVLRSEVSAYAHFNDFFTRELKPAARPLDPDPNAFLCPSDGRISQCGRATNERLLQAKGHSYSVRALLANDPLAAEFLGGFFYTIYLSPRDYHRVHMPLDGRLLRMIHVPGRLFSVSPATVRQVPNLFARNERVISLFETSHGPMAIVLVGAMMVSSIDTAWAGTIKPARGNRVSTGDWSRRDIELKKGQEMGRFNMGSTVIVLLPAGAVSALAELGPDDIVRMGQKLGRLR